MPPRRSAGSQSARENDIPTNAELAQAVRQLAQLTQAIGDRMLQNPQGNGNGNDMAKLVAGRNPPIFLGQEDPLVLEEWMRVFDKLFDALNCPAERHVDIAVYYLQQRADIWWAVAGPTLRQSPTFGWEAFKDALREKFYPEHEYYTDFLDLSRFAPALVPDERSKASKFIRGLNFETQKGLSMFRCQTLDEAYSRAASHCQVQQFQREVAGKGKRKSEEDRQQGEKRPKFPHPGQNHNYQGKGGPRNHNGHQVQRNQRAERHYNCKRCNKDHPGVDCQGNVVKCFNCNRMGHRAFECYAKKNGNPSWQNQNKNGGNKNPSWQNQNKNGGNNGKNLGGGNQNNRNGNRNGSDNKA
ncbi:uncharacterized protein LOC116007914 [Ipomoea triloba]|uniref:uncharacterized protein LOC116007914 n=1 Tax=Ipomoea triloba TaxID=35885 RepID=UPI00125D14D9|nr:uncharacterized protein LOC116007914 [Ipomoea triloba]